MVWLMALLMVVLWAIGVASSTMLGGFIHVLLVGAGVLVATRLVRRTRPVH